MSWGFVLGFACGAVLFDVLWRFTFHKWMKLHERQQEHYDCFTNNSLKKIDDL